MSKDDKIRVYKRCFVPSCKNSTTRTPDKNFFYVPKDNLEDWCYAAGYKGAVKPGLKICEDHLDLEKALVNYKWWRTMGGRGILVDRPPILKNCKRPGMQSKTSNETNSKDLIKLVLRLLARNNQAESKQATENPVDRVNLSSSPEPLTSIPEDSASDCDMCNTRIVGLQYYCIQCSDFKVCAECERDAHETHYLLRVPQGRPKDEIDQVLRAIRDLLSHEEFLPTEYLSLRPTDKPAENKEPEFTDIEFLEDDVFNTTENISETVPETIRESFPETIRETTTEPIPETTPATIEASSKSIRETSPETIRETDIDIREDNPQSVRETSPVSIRETIPKTARETIEETVPETVPPSPVPSVVEIRDDNDDNFFYISDSDDDLEDTTAESPVPNIDPKSIIGHELNGAVIVKQPRRRDSEGIWSQHQGRQQPVDDEAAKVLVELVSSKRYQDMFKVEKRHTVWQELSKEMINMGYIFGTRDAAKVCAQKWRNLELKMKRQLIGNVVICEE